MREKLSKIFSWLKTHKLLSGLAVVILLVLNFGVRPRVTSALKGPAEKYETAKVRKGSLRETVSASGKVEAETQVTLKFQTSGKLAWVGVKEGDYVKKWQAIASLDKRELEKDLKNELLDYMSERWDFEQDREDYNITSDDLDSYTLENEIRRILDKAQFDLDSTVIDVEIAALAVELATMVSPIEGIVTSVEEPVAGVNITPATAEVTIANPSSMKFVANVDEADIGQVKLGQRAIISLDAYPDQGVEGEISQVAFASVATSGGGTAFPVEIYLPENSQENFKIGMNGDTEIIIHSQESTLLIPLEALYQKNDEAWVEIIEDKKVKKVKVETGIEDETMIEITQGLKEGQMIITGEKEK